MTEHATSSASRHTSVNRQSSTAAEVYDRDPTNRWRCTCVGRWERDSVPNPTCPIHANFCGCCGNQVIIDPSAETEPFWCLRCLGHVDLSKSAHNGTYFAQHGIDCPFQVTAEDPWLVPLEHRPTCPLSGRPCTSWACLVDVCVAPDA